LKKVTVSMGKLALVLSGGGARGAFQAGALVELLRYLDETGRRINILSGTSVGALNGMSIAQAPSLAAAREEIEQQWKHLTNDDVYHIRGWGIFALVLRFAVTPMDRWSTVRGVDSLFDNSPLYKRFIEGYLNMDAIRAKGTVDDFYVSLSSLNTGAAYLRSITTEPDRRKSMEYIMASTITTVAYPPVRTTVEDPELPPHLAAYPQLYADGGISNKTPLKAVLRFGGISELFVVNTYPSYPNKTEHSIKTTFPNVFSMLMRTALELLPNLYFLRDMGTVRDVNNDLRVWEELKARVLAAAPDAAVRARLEEVLRQEGERLSFREGGKQIIDPVIIAPDEELPVQDTEFVHPQLGKTFEMGREKARRVLSGRGTMENGRWKMENRK
jgi:predicted acylesterase/phospholipase RssA